MPLTSGAHIGPYEVVALLGEGGMGQVYRARDTRLNRDVAIKVLPADVTADPERLARFAEEARATAALNHPNILQVYDVGTDAGTSYIVSELLDGRTLRDLLGAETLSVSRVVDLAGQVADGLSAAHARQIVHRDLKPENVFVTTDGRAKILDFGLAKAITPNGKNVEAETRVATAPHTILGTVGYMSPEQVRGQPADNRSDIFSFGCLLYEMATGRKAFSGESVHDALSAILRDPPAPLESTASRPLPPTLVRIVDRFLEKTPSGRFQSTTDLAFALKSLSSASGAMMTDSGTGFTRTPVPASGPGARSSVPWRTIVPWAVAAIAVVVAAVAWSMRGNAEPPKRRYHLVIRGAGNQQFRTGSNWSMFALFADGSKVVYSLVPEGSRPGGAGGTSGPLYVQGLDEPEGKPIAGTDGGVRPILSPDGKWLVFTDGSNVIVKKVSLDGGEPVVLADNISVGGTWASSTELVLGQLNVGLLRLPAMGGALTPIVRVDKSKDEVSYTHPQVLPNGGILFTIVKSNRQHAVAALPSGSSTIKTLTDGMHPQFVPPGYLIFARQSTLFAVSFDPDRLEMHGEPVPVLQGVLADLSGGQSNFSVSQDGSLAYLPGIAFGTGSASTFVWLDRHGGNEQAIPLRPQRYAAGRLSPDGRVVAAVVRNDDGSGGLWRGDVDRGTLTAITSDPVFDCVWSLDGKRVEYRKMDGTLWSRPADLSAPETRLLDGLTLPGGNQVGFATRDGNVRVIGGTSSDASKGSDIWIATTGTSGSKPSLAPWLSNNLDEAPKALSPDGKWLLYWSGRAAIGNTEHNQLYIQPFPGPGAVVPVTKDSAASSTARWIGSDVFYMLPGGGVTTTLMTARARTEPTLAIEVPTPLFRFQRNYTWDDVAQDGQRFLLHKDVSATAERQSPTELHVIVNWIEDVKERLGTH